MATTSQLDRVTAIVLRYMRPPLFVLITVYAIGVTGMALMPGQDANGNPVHMSLFHAFYFLTYTLTTTGFGEIPGEFTDQQRLWAIFCLFIGVVAWLYAIGSIITLVQNQHFLQAVAERRFAHTVRRISEPFFLVCGFGDTGSLLARGLSENYLSAVVLDSDNERIKALALRDYRVQMPGLCVDASVPQHLIDAGVRQPNCRAVVALTNNEDINLKIAVMTRYLNPSVRVVCRSTSDRHEAHLRALDAVDVVDPFEMFAEQIGTRVTAPRLNVLGDWLVWARGVQLSQSFPIPTGNWVLCSYGRMGHRLHTTFSDHGIPTVVIDPEADAVPGALMAVRGQYDIDSLRQAGIEEAAGIVAGTNSDADNLEILLSARTLNPTAFSIVRQNSHENELAFDCASANLIMQPSLITARKILLVLISPQVQDLLNYLGDTDEAITEDLIEQLSKAIGNDKPILWRLRADAQNAPALLERLRTDRSVALTDLLRDPRDRNAPLPCIPLVLTRGERTHVLPADTELLEPEDEILFCGTRQAEHLLHATANNVHTLAYLVSGTDAPRGYLFRWLCTVFKKRQAAA